MAGRRVHGLLWAIAVCLASAVTSRDRERARQLVPRARYRGSALIAANVQLNQHLATHDGISLVACEQFSTVHLRKVLHFLYAHADPELKAIYPSADGRSAQYKSLAQMEAAWALLPTNDTRVRDAHCHEAVMWYIHHLSTAEQARTRMLVQLPSLPMSDHSVATRTADDETGKFYDSKVTCQDCHVAGLVNPQPPVPERPPSNAAERSRRCDTNYKELFGIDCGPCDGIDGISTGDDIRYFHRTQCEVVALPAAVKQDDRVMANFPAMFTVQVAGSSDHLCPKRKGDPRMYSISRGKMYADVRPESDLWLLRHESTFSSLMVDGAPIVPHFSSGNTTQIHAQTFDQRSRGISGPQVSLSEGMPEWMPTGCSCQVDVVGVPTTQTMQNLQYMGRIRLPNLEFVGGAIELDHWANWFFHIFMDTNTSQPHYGKAPSRISDNSGYHAKTGFSVYGEWEFGDPKIKDPSVWHRGIPTKDEAGAKPCFNADRTSFCEDISQSNFPPRG